VLVALRNGDRAGVDRPGAGKSQCWLR